MNLEIVFLFSIIITGAAFIRGATGISLWVLIGGSILSWIALTLMPHERKEK